MMLNKNSVLEKSRNFVRISVLLTIVLAYVGTVSLNASAQLPLTSQDIIRINKGEFYYDPESELLPCGVGENSVALSPIAEERKEAAYNYFVTRLTEAANPSFAKEQSAGILGNLLAEAGVTMDPATEQGSVNIGFNPDAETGYGLAQWTSSGRKYRLQSFAQATGRSIDDFSMQLDFIWFEMTGEPSDPGLPQGATEANSFNKLILKTSAEDAAVSWASLYERNADSIAYGNGELSYEKAFRTRINNAQQVFIKYGGNPVGLGPSLGGGCVDAPANTNQCANGTIDLGINDTYVKGVRSTGVLCAVTNLPSSGKASRLGNSFYVDGSNGFAIVSAELSGRVYDMVDAAALDGIVLRANSSFRTNENQNALCNGNTNCSNGTFDEVARPGYSSHESGSAIDFKNMSDDTLGGRTCSTRDKPNTPEWKWMLDNAENFGYLQYSKEGWHWDTRSDLANRCDSSEV